MFHSKYEYCFCTAVLAAICRRVNVMQTDTWAALADDFVYVSVRDQNEWKDAQLPFKPDERFG